VFLVNSRYPLVCATYFWLPKSRSSFSRSYRCNLPSSFSIVLSSALVYSTCPPVLVWGTVFIFEESYFLGVFHCTLNPIRVYSLQPPSLSSRFRNINLIPIDYAFQPRLRGRLTLRRLTLRRKPWTFGENVFHILCRYSCQHSHFRYLQQLSRAIFKGLRNAPLPLIYFLTNIRLIYESTSSVHNFSPVTLSVQKNLFRLVSYYAFFKGWLLLSQPPSCYGLSTSFNT